MIKTMLHNTKTGETRWGDEGLLAEWNANPDLWIWADFNNADPEHEMKLFIDAFNLHPLAIADARRERHPPKLELFDDYLFLLMKGLDADTTDVDFNTIQIAFLSASASW